MTASARMAVRAGVVLVVLAAFVFVGCGGDDDTNAVVTTTETTVTTTQTEPPSTTETTPKPTPIPPATVRIRVVDGAPKGGIVREKVDQGERVVIIVSSDVADEVHLHGYDVSRPVAAGGTARLRFRATIPGRFEVELEERGVPIGEISVQP